MAEVDGVVSPGSARQERKAGTLYSPAASGVSELVVRRGGTNHGRGSGIGMQCEMK